MTEPEACQELLTMFRTAWSANGATAAGVATTPLVQWPGVEYGPPDLNAPFARITVKHFQGRQASLANFDGVRLWDRVGLVTVECFSPRSKGKGRLALDMAKAAKDAFEGKRSPGGAWFKDCRTLEIGSESGWYKAQAICQFTYTEVK